MLVISSFGLKSGVFWVLIWSWFRPWGFVFGKHRPWLEWLSLYFSYLLLCLLLISVCLGAITVERGGVGWFGFLFLLSFMFLWYVWLLIYCSLRLCLTQGFMSPLITLGCSSMFGMGRLSDRWQVLILVFGGADGEDEQEACVLFS
jgi:hypothetical protein